MVVQCLKPIAGCKAALVGVDLEIRRLITRYYSHNRIKIFDVFPYYKKNRYDTYSENEDYYY